MKQIDILLINPKSISYQNLPQPLGLAYLASYAEKHNYNVKILDMCKDTLDADDFKSYLSKLNPKFVGFNCFTIHIPFVKEYSKYVRDILPNATIIVGGSHPSALPLFTMDELEKVDIAVVGEGEETLLDILNGKRFDKIDGIMYRKDRRIKSNKPRRLIEDLDSIPFPARHLLRDIKEYDLSLTWECKRPSAHIFSSRGCPCNCTYCASKVIWGRRVRFRSAKDVVDEVRFLIENYKVNSVLFYDDNFLINKERLKQISSELKDEDINIGCLSRVDTIDEEKVQYLKKAHCNMISFGVESGSQKMLDTMKKNVKVEQIYRAFNICKKYHINTKASFILGTPGETSETIRETFSLVKKIMPDYVWFFVMTPLPGTELYEFYKQHGIHSENWIDYNQTTYKNFYNTNLNYEELRRIISKAYKDYYLDPRYLFSQLMKLDYNKLRTFLYLVKNVFVISRYIQTGKTHSTVK